MPSANAEPCALSAKMTYYLRTVHHYTEGEGDPHTSWVVSGWQRTEAALRRRGLIEMNPHPRRRRDRQSVRLTDAGREALATYAGRETVMAYTNSNRRHVVWAAGE